MLTNFEIIQSNLKETSDKQHKIAIVKDTKVVWFGKAKKHFRELSNLKV